MLRHWSRSSDPTMRSEAIALGTQEAASAAAAFPLGRRHSGYYCDGRATSATVAAAADARHERAPADEP